MEFTLPVFMQNQATMSTFFVNLQDIESDKNMQTITNDANRRCEERRPALGFLKPYGARCQYE
jgi:hypothetical protein